MTDLITRAKEFAFARHGNQMHGSVPITEHLTAVAGFATENAGRYFFNEYEEEVAIAAAWLHDVFEDTTTTYTELVDNFGVDVASAVWGVTDRKGNTRYERHLNTYCYTRKNPISVFVKLCDRWHNQRRSSIAGKVSKHMKKYYYEYTYFKFALYEPGSFSAIWDELDEQHNFVREIIENENLK